VIEPFIAGRQHHQIRFPNRTVVELQALGDEPLDVGGLNQTNFSSAISSEAPTLK
jgi:hypothetical protein